MIRLLFLAVLALAVWGAYRLGHRRGRRDALLEDTRGQVIDLAESRRRKRDRPDD